jgi:hypothetical protein
MRTRLDWPLRRSFCIADELGSLLGGMQTVAVLLFDLCDRANASAKVGNLGQLLLDCLQPFMPLAMGNVGLCVTSALTPIFMIQFLKVSDLLTETANLFPKDCQMIHVIRITHLPWNRQKTARNLRAVRICRRSRHLLHVRDKLRPAFGYLWGPRAGFSCP